MAPAEEARPSVNAGKPIACRLSVLPSLRDYRDLCGKKTFLLHHIAETSNRGQAQEPTVGTSRLSLTRGGTREYLDRVRDRREGSHRWLYITAHRVGARRFF
jgi:hypothetical protein